jgi:hypothetical protein
MRRRALLSAAGAGLSATALGGYLATSGDVLGIGGSTEPVPEPSGPTRGESDADVQTEVVEDDPDVEYLEDEDAVRYVARWSSSGAGADEGAKTDSAGRKAVYETVPFDQWAGNELLAVAGAAAMAHVNEVLEGDDVGYGVGSGGGDQQGSIAYVSMTTVLNREGKVAVGSDGERMDFDVAFDELVAATPATVTARYRLGGESVARDVPMYAVHRVMQQM